MLVTSSAEAQFSVYKTELDVGVNMHVWNLKMRRALTERERECVCVCVCVCAQLQEYQ